MKKESQTSLIYKKELLLTERIKEIMKDNNLSKDRLMQELARIGYAYDKLLDNTLKIVRVADVNQKKLMHALEIEKEKIHLQQIVRDQAKDIQDKYRKLEEQTALFKEMAETKSRFFANISHEFRTPLTLIMGPLEQMLQESQTKEEKRKISLMLRNSQRMLGLINQLLELAKFESGKMELKTCKQNLVPFLKGLVTTFELLSSQNDLDLVFENQKSNISIYYDREKMEEVIFNLLLNSIKFTPPGGRITIKVTDNPEIDSDFPCGFVSISISDTGPGIPSERLEHIFDRFYQGDASNESKYKGSGIGLAIAREIIELHHGDIEVISSTDQATSGTEFIVRLPMGNSHLKPDEIVISSSEMKNNHTLDIRREIKELYMSEKEEKDYAFGNRIQPEDPLFPNEPEQLKSNQEIILVVEDNPDSRNYIKSTLNSFYTIMEAKTGREGLQKSQKIIPDLIILDVLLPEMNGYEICMILKNDIRTSHIPIILLTAKAAEEDIIRGLNSGADDYVIKPYNTRILAARVHNLIELRKQFQQNLKREMTEQPTRIFSSRLDQDFLEDLQRVVRDNLSDPNFNVHLLCKKLYMSRPTVYRKILAMSGESPNEFIRSYRLQLASQLLKNRHETILDIAMKVGFSSANYFCKCFKNKYHNTPAVYREINSR